MSDRVEASEPTKRVVFGESGGFCVNPDCRSSLKVAIGAGATWIGECAHIAGERETAQRFDPGLSVAERSSDANLIALCASCHTAIDKPGAEATFPSTVLHRWKQQRILEVSTRAAQHVMDVGFQELSRVVRALVHEGFRDDTDGDITVVTPDEKLKHNTLSPDIRALVARGLARREEVVRYLHHERRVTPSIAEQVRSAIVESYRRCRARSSGDALFNMVWSDVASGLFGDADRAAALVVVCYFFEACDIFERPDA